MFSQSVLCPLQPNPPAQDGGAGSQVKGGFDPKAAPRMVLKRKRDAGDGGGQGASDDQGSAEKEKEEGDIAFKNGEFQQAAER